MKALSVQQPWAWLIVNGYKDIENREWPTKYRGQFFIHAGKKFDREGAAYINFAFPHIILPTFAQHSAGSGSNSLGGIVGEARIIDCVTSSASPWFFGQHGFVIRDAKPLPFRPYKGQLGFFEVADKEQR
jgi:hypothetical protein